MTKIMIAAALATALVAGPAFAVPVKWTLSGVTYDDGGTASGSFIYDADTNAYSAINITTTTGSTRTGAAYIAVNPNIMATSSAFYLLTAGGSFAGQPMAGFPTVAKTNAGGTLPLSLEDAEATCDNTPCLTALVSGRRLTAGSITAISPAPVPTMTEWATILFGIVLAGGAALFIQRRRQAA